MAREELQDPDDSQGQFPLKEASEYDLAGDAAPAPVRRAAQRSAPAARASVATDAVSRYPRRTAKPVALEASATEAAAESPFKSVYLPLAMLAVGLGLRVGQLIFASEARGNHWWGKSEGAAAGGLGKALLLVLFEMIIASAFTAVGAVVAVLLLSIEVGPPAKAALKLCASAVFATGVVCWVAMFDRGAYSVAGLTLALHVMVILYWITLGYLFSLELQELLLTVAAITLAHSMVILLLWRGG